MFTTHDWEWVVTIPPIRIWFSQDMGFNLDMGSCREWGRERHDFFNGNLRGKARAAPAFTP